MASLITHSPDTGYLSFENHSAMPPETDSNYYPVNVYSKDFRVKKDKRVTFCDFLLKCCCCYFPKPIDYSDSTIYSPSTSLTKPKKSYTLTQTDAPAPVSVEPSLIVSRTLEDKMSKSTTQLLLTTETIASSTSLSTPKYEYTVKKIKTRESSEETTDSCGSTLKSGEKISFIRDILIYRDSFLKSLEWCDNSLTRGKRCRRVKPDEWLELKMDGTNIILNSKALEHIK